MPDQELLGLSDSDTAALVRRLTEDWNPSLRCLFDNFDASLNRIVSVKPPIPTWEGHARVTLVGDSIHAMSPTAAFGATSALQDAGLLAQKLGQCKDNNNICVAVWKYEDEMREYTKGALEKSAMGGKVMFGMKSYDELPVIEAVIH